MTKNLEQEARESLRFIPTSGIDGISQRNKECLTYGLEHGLFTQKDVDSAQRKYEESHKKR